jgi:hypothetical protein
MNLLAEGAEVEMTLWNLPGISRWGVYRLEEEGVRDIGALATADSRKLTETIPIAPEMINLWLDVATLMTVLGTAKYEEIKEICLTASHFVKRVHEDEEFVATLANKFKISNAAEIADILSTNFSIQPPA